MPHELLRGAYDLHVHSAPDVAARKYTDLELAKRFSQAGLRGFAIKSHMFNTGARAALIRELFPGLNAVGCLALNRSTGGVNPVAVEMAGRIGVKIVYFPTMDAQNEYDFDKRTGKEKSYGAGPAPTIPISPISIFGPQRKLVPEVYTVIELIKQYDMVLATGHLSKEESFALLKAGKETGLKKMVVTHPEYPACFANAREQLEYIRLGAKLEYCYHTVWSGNCAYETAYSLIREMGPQNILITSDMGQVGSPDPEEGLSDYVTKLLSSGFTKGEVRKMIAENPIGLIE